MAGVYGRWVHVLDGRYKYARGPVTEDNLPLSMWSNRWSTMPVPQIPALKLPMPDRNAFLDFMPGSEIPVIRQPFQPGDMLPYWCANQRPNQQTRPRELDLRLTGGAGLLLTAGLYLLMYAIGAKRIPQLEIFLDRGWVPYAVTYLTCWCAVILTFKYRRVADERARQGNALFLAFGISAGSSPRGLLDLHLETDNGDNAIQLKYS